MSALVKLEQELVQVQDDIKVCNDMLAIDPTDSDALESKALLKEQSSSLLTQIAAEKAKQSAASPPPPPDNAPPPPPPKYDMSKHPKFRKASPEVPPPPPEDVSPTVFNVKDQVMAKYSEDKQWYQASIISKTGSSSDPVYTVNFKGYGNTETKRKHEVRPIESKKRKADGPIATPTPQLPASPLSAAAHGSVISAAPSVDPSLVQKREPSKVSDGPTRMAPEPKKLKGNKALDKAKSSWNDWQKSGPKKSTTLPQLKKKDSQFRTSDLPNAKVGFIGSGKSMQKDQARSKWNYGEELEDDNE